MAPADPRSVGGLQGRPGPAVVAGVLLTGGGSRRMGRDKATLIVGGERLADRTASLLGRVADPVIEVGPGYTSLPGACEDPPGSGPLAALAAGAELLLALGGRGRASGGSGPRGPERPALVVATDLPRLTAGLLRVLAEHPGPGCVVPLDGDGRPQYGCARYSAEAMGQAPILLAAGHRSLKALLERSEVTWIPLSEWIEAAGAASAVIDVDTPDDLAGLEASRSGEE